MRHRVHADRRPSPTVPEMTAAYFHLDDGRLVPEHRAHGPWAEDMLHGRLVGGVAARQLELDHGEPGWRATRLTVDLFRPAAMAPVTVETRPVRVGRKVKVVDAMIDVDGHTVGRVTALFLTEGDEPPGSIWRPHHEPWPAPDEVAAPTDGTGSKEQTEWLFRVVEGGMGSAERSRVWTNDTAQLVAGEDMTPLVRAAVSGDIVCPLVNFSDDGLHYINADYTMLIGRYPEGPWIGIESTDQVGADGVTAALGTMYDERGVFGMSGGGSLARPPLRH